MARTNFTNSTRRWASRNPVIAWLVQSSLLIVVCSGGLLALGSLSALITIASWWLSFARLSVVSLLFLMILILALQPIMSRFVAREGVRKTPSTKLARSVREEQKPTETKSQPIAKAEDVGESVARESRARLSVAANLRADAIATIRRSTRVQFPNHCHLGVPAELDLQVTVERPSFPFLPKLVDSPLLEKPPEVVISVCVTAQQRFDSIETGRVWSCFRTRDSNTVGFRLTPLEAGVKLIEIELFRTVRQGRVHHDRA